MNRIEVCKRLWRTGCVAVGLAWLASCGGSGTQVEPFVPTRILVFGDEQSLLLNDGRKYSVNAVDATTLQRNCASLPIWTQSLASNFGMVFPECNPNNVANPQGRMFATVGATADDVKVQVDAYLGGDTFSRTDLVTVFAGMHDILNLYAQFPGLSESDLTQEAARLGTVLAEQINRIARADGRVLFVTVPDLGRTPFALAEDQLNPEGVRRTTLLSNLTKSFNDQLKRDVINDGRFIGLVLEDDLSRTVTSNPGLNGYVNASSPVCLSTAVLPDCSTETLIPEVAKVSTSFYWADATHLSPGAHNNLASLALARARGNPF